MGDGHRLLLLEWLHSSRSECVKGDCSQHSKLPPSFSALPCAHSLSIVFLPCTNTYFHVHTQGWFLFHECPASVGPVWQVHHVVGLALWLTGWLLNYQADGILRNLRTSPTDTGDVVTRKRLRSNTLAAHSAVVGPACWCHTLSVDRSLSAQSWRQLGATRQLALLSSHPPFNTPPSPPHPCHPTTPYTTTGRLQDPPRWPVQLRISCQLQRRVSGVDGVGRSSLMAKFVSAGSWYCG